MTQWHAKHMSASTAAGAPDPAQVSEAAVSNLGQPASSTIEGQAVAVSAIMPVLNEADHLAAAVNSVFSQDYQGEIELVLALGPSRDDTDAVAARLAVTDDRITLVRNPSGRTPSGLNAALSATSHDIVVRVDGHCELPADYIRIAVETLGRTGADNVGGIMAAQGQTPFESAVAVAMTSKLGVGAASFHVGGAEGETETVYLGVFRAQTLQKVGGYDEEFDRAQDWEMNHRIRMAGGKIWFNPAIQVAYRPRPNVKALAKQYFHYGQWRREVMRRYPDTVSLRYLAPPVAVSALAAGTIAGIAGSLTGSSSLKLGYLAPATYATAVAVGGWLTAKREPVAVKARVPLVLATMHCSWGVGFLTSRRRTLRD